MRGVHDVSGALVHDDVLHPADLVEDRGEGLLLRLRMHPPVTGVGEKLVGCFLAVSRDSVTPLVGHEAAFGARIRSAKTRTHSELLRPRSSCRTREGPPPPPHEAPERPEPDARSHRDSERQ